MDARIEGRLRSQLVSAFKSIYMDEDGYTLVFGSEQLFHSDKPIPPNEIDIVFKDSGGQILFGNRVVPLVIYVMTEQDSINTAREMMQSFTALNNQVKFSFTDDAGQSTSVYPMYNSPVDVGNFETVGNGYRSMLYVGGTLVVTSQVMDISSVGWGVYNEDSKEYDFSDVPFIQASVDFSSSLNSQPWYGNDDMATSKPKWGTLTFSLSVQSTNTDLLKKILATMVKDTGNMGDGVRNVYHFKMTFDNGIVMENDFYLAQAHYGKEIGGIPTMSMSFSL